jgi:hypothetical protein
MICNELVSNGILVRYIATIASFFVLYDILKTNLFIEKYFYLLLPFLLTFLDELDNIFTIFYKYKGKYNGCTKTFYYQYTDKICDSISYLLVYFFFKIDFVFLYFVLYRIIGVLLFCITKNSKWLILFFDFAKEYILYLFVFGNELFYMPIFVILKICFEIYFHTIVNKNNY